MKSRLVFPNRLALAFLAMALPLLLTACASKFTESNLQKIHDGMTPDEVKAVLGPPTEVQDQNIMGINSTVFIYRASHANGKIVFVNGKELTKEGEFK